MTHALANPLVLSLYPNVSGLCFAVFEGHLKPVDWGIKTARRDKHPTVMRHATWLMDVFHPATIILPVRETVVQGSRRLKTLATEIESLAKRSGMTVLWYSRSDIKACFTQLGAQSKDTITTVIANLLPEFQQHVPPTRKIWMSEDYRMGLFDAVALAITYYRDAERAP